MFFFSLAAEILSTSQLLYQSFILYSGIVLYYNQMLLLNSNSEVLKLLFIQSGGQNY